MADLIAIGEALFELNQPHDGAPFSPGFGGDTSNAMIAAARSGASTGYFTAVGADRFGQSLVELWRAEGRRRQPGDRQRRRPYRHLFRDARPRGPRVFLSARGFGGEPHHRGRRARRLYRRGAAAACLGDQPGDFLFGDRRGFRRHRHRASSVKVLVSYDTNLRLKLWPLKRAKAVIHEAMKSVDIALPGLDDARQLTGLDQPDAIVDFYLRLGAGIVALTLGKEGALVATPQRRERIASIPVEAIDATGAGDAFDGAFLAEFLGTADPFKAASLRQCRRRLVDARLWRGSATANARANTGGARQNVRKGAIRQPRSAVLNFIPSPAVLARLHRRRPVARRDAWP